MGTSIRADCNDLTLGPGETPLLEPVRSGKLPCSLRRDEPCPYFEPSIDLWPARLIGMVIGIVLGWLLRGAPW
jgi:hypothetical protein